MTERFKKAYDALVRAYFEGTLAKGSCIACACGNIIFNAIGEPLTKEIFKLEVAKYRTRFLDEYDVSVLKTFRDKAESLWSSKRNFSGASCIRPIPQFEHDVNESGYTVKEFTEIEEAFEMNTKLSISRYFCTFEQDILEDQYKGLCAVVDVLMKLDEQIEGADELKQEFRKHPKLTTV